MSGHSKWSKVKHQKGVTDSVKSAEFTRASRAISVAVREGGNIADPEKNFRLRLAIEHARSVNMPKDTIDRALEKAAGNKGSEVYNIIYEGYGPGGVAILVEAATDNRQRTSALVKHEFDRNGGSLAGPGAVQYQFRKSGVMIVDKPVSYDILFEKAITLGADDIIERDDLIEIYTPFSGLHAVSEKLVDAGFSVRNTQLILRPERPVSVQDEIRDRIETFITALESLDDVQNVYTNID